MILVKGNVYEGFRRADCCSERTNAYAHSLDCHKYMEFAVLFNLLNNGIVLPFYMTKATNQIIVNHLFEASIKG